MRRYTKYVPVCLRKTLICTYNGINFMAVGQSNHLFQRSVKHALFNVIKQNHFRHDSGTLFLITNSLPELSYLIYINLRITE